MSHRAAKQVRQFLRRKLGRDIDLERRYIASWCSVYTAMNIPGSDRAVMQTTKRNYKRRRNGMEQVQPRNHTSVDKPRRKYQR